MPIVTFTAQFVSYIKDHEVELTEEEWKDLQSGKKKYWDFIDESDSVEGEWTEGYYNCWDE